LIHRGIRFQKGERITPHLRSRGFQVMKMLDHGRVCSVSLRALSVGQVVKNDEAFKMSSSILAYPVA
jgi:hypothetical protein